MPSGKRRGSIGKSDITEGMRAILVDWLVEVQESFELNHETLYTAVKLMDLYLSKVKLQMITYLNIRRDFSLRFCQNIILYYGKHRFSLQKRNFNW